MSSRQALTPRQMEYLACMSEAITADDIGGLLGREACDVTKSLRRLARRRLVHQAGKVRGRGKKPRTLWCRSDAGESVSVTTEDALDVVDWIVDAVLCGDARSAKHYAEDLGITQLVAIQRIAEATRRGWLDSTLYPTDEGLAARESSMRKSS